jgi:hypothetical protein
MQTNEIIFVSLIVVFLFSTFLSIGITIYLGKRKIKEIDRIVFGYEIIDDNIFYQMLRLPRYGGAFAWRWSAKRANLLQIRDQFDKKFQRPFIINFWLIMFGAFCMIILFVLDKWFLHITN